MTDIRFCISPGCGEPCATQECASKYCPAHRLESKRERDRIYRASRRRRTRQREAMRIVQVRKRVAFKRMNTARREAMERGVCPVKAYDIMHSPPEQAERMITDILNGKRSYAQRAQAQGE